MPALRSVLELDELMRPFAIAIHAKVQLLRGLDRHNSAAALVRDAVTWEIKIASNFHQPQQSRAAREMAKEMKVDLKALTWGRQPSIDPGRKIFAFEHYRPVSALRDVCLGCSSADAILHVLLDQLVVVWVLRTENAELDRQKYRWKRPDPAKAYSDAGIILVDDE